jgi:iron complex outermembrane receptor protein
MSRFPSLPAAPRALALLIIVAQALAAQAPGIRDTTEADSSRVFKLGEIEVVVARQNPSPIVADAIGVRDLRLYHRTDLAQGLGLIPGVSVSAVGPRNEAGVFVRGYDLRQVPLLVDGIPVYVPYDGYVDLGRFTTYDVGSLQVSKGASSVLLGPNALGGALNVVSRRPAAALELAGGTGLFTAGGREAWLNAGTRQSRWYVQGSGSYLTQDAFRLPDGFRPVTTEDGGNRQNSYRTDWRASAKLGLTPRATDEYALVVAWQDGEKGNPPYSGPDPAQLSRARFWRWPEWNKRSVSLLSQTALSERVVVKGRGYYDRFDNILDSYDDTTYTAQTRPFAFHSVYQDDTWGGSGQVSVTAQASHVIGLAVHAKLDRHQEHNRGEPVRTYRDRTLSVGIEDSWRVSRRVTLVPGVSYDHRRGLEADDFVGGQVLSADVSASGSLNPQLVALVDIGPGRLQASVSRKSRFPTIKDRYSYRLGSAIPNPDLTAERVTHLVLDYAATPIRGLSIRAAGYYSRIEDLISQVDSVATDSTGRPLFQLQNVGDARFVGFEVGVDLQPIHSTRMGTSYAWIDRRNLTNPDIHLLDVPKARFQVFGEVAPVRLVTVLARLEWNSSRFVTSQGFTVDPFTVVDARASVGPFGGATVEGGITNLFDREYYLANGFPDPGRTVFVGVRWSTAGALP